MKQIKKRENVALKQYTDPNTSIEYSNDMQDVYSILKTTIQIKNVKY